MKKYESEFIKYIGKFGIKHMSELERNFFYYQIEYPMEIQGFIEDYNWDISHNYEGEEPIGRNQILAVHSEIIETLYERWCKENCS